MPNEITQLTPAEEFQFQAWARANKIADVDAPESKYDYRGYWKEYGDKPIRFGQDHFTDTYKQHGHPLFSAESKYSRGPQDGGRWIGEDTLVPPPMASHNQALTPPLFMGNIDLARQPRVQNPDGGTSTVFSRSFGIDGAEVLLPSVTPDGRFLASDDEVLAEYERTGRHLGRFRTPAEATAYAKLLHEAYERGHIPKPVASHPRGVGMPKFSGKR